MIPFHETRAWTYMRNSLADHVDAMGFEFAARMIREDVRYTASISLSYVENGDPVELLRDIRDLAKDGVRYIRISEEPTPTIIGIPLDDES